MSDKQPAATEPRQHLAECPFCGARSPNLIADFVPNTQKQVKFMRCLECHAQGPWSTKAIDEVDGWELRARPSESAARTAKQQFDELAPEDTTPLERLRFFCSLAMNGQDWLDVEPFFDALATPSAIGTPIPSSLAEVMERVVRCANMREVNAIWDQYRRDHE